MISKTWTSWEQSHVVIIAKLFVNCKQTSKICSTCWQFGPYINYSVTKGTFSNFTRTVLALKYFVCVCFYVTTYYNLWTCLCDDRMEARAYLRCCSAFVKVWRCVQCWRALVTAGKEVHKRNTSASPSRLQRWVTIRRSIRYCCWPLVSSFPMVLTCLWCSIHCACRPLVLNSRAHRVWGRWLEWRLLAAMTFCRV